MPTTSVAFWKGARHAKRAGLQKPEKDSKKSSLPTVLGCFFPVSSDLFLKEPFVIASVKPLKLPPQPCPCSSLEEAEDTLRVGSSEKLRREKK